MFCKVLKSFVYFKILTIKRNLTSQVNQIMTKCRSGFCDFINRIKILNMKMQMLEFFIQIKVHKMSTTKCEQISNILIEQQMNTFNFFFFCCLIYSIFKLKNKIKKKIEYLAYNYYITIESIGLWTKAKNVWKII